MVESQVAVAPTLDAFIRERERRGVEEGEGCEYRLGRGHPLSQKRCSTCKRLSHLIDLSTSWTQRIDTGRLAGRSVEIVVVTGPRDTRDLENAWDLYRECDAAQRASRQSLLRRYYSYFKCAGSYYALRDVTLMSLPPLAVMLAQLIELFGGLPPAFVHGNPTAASISFLGRLPTPLKHTVPALGDDATYSSRYLIQVDYGGVDSTALTSFSLAKAASSRIVDEPLGAVIVDSVRNTLTVRPEASFSSILREYLRHSRSMGLYMLMRGLISLYPESEVSEYKDVFTKGGSGSMNLHGAFEDLRGVVIPIDIATLLKERLLKKLS